MQWQTAIENHWNKWFPDAKTIDSIQIGDGAFANDWNFAKMTLKPKKYGKQLENLWKQKQKYIKFSSSKIFHKQGFLLKCHEIEFVVIMHFFGVFHGQKHRY